MTKKGIAWCTDYTDYTQGARIDSACVRTLSGGDDVATLLALLTTRARQHHDGHYTILAFTTGYKVAFGTPDIYPGGTAYAQVQAMPQFPTLKEALVHALLADKWSMPAAADN